LVDKNVYSTVLILPISLLIQYATGSGPSPVQCDICQHQSITKLYENPFSRWSQFTNDRPTDRPTDRQTLRGWFFVQVYCV